MIKQLKICNERAQIEWAKKDKNDWITLIIK